MQKKADTTASGAPFAAAANGAAEDGHPSAAAEAGGASEAQVPSAGNGSDSETDLTPPVTEVIAEGFTPSVSDDGSTWRGDPARRIDPTRYERVVAAMKLVRRLKPDKRHSERGYPYVSKAALYDHIRQCLAACGLHVRSRLNKPIEVCADLDLGSTRSSNKNVAKLTIAEINDAANRTTACRCRATAVAPGDDRSRFRRRAQRRRHSHDGWRVGDIRRGLNAAMRRRSGTGAVRRRHAHAASKHLPNQNRPINTPGLALPVNPAHLLRRDRKAELPIRLRPSQRRRSVSFIHHQTPTATEAPERRTYNPRHPTTQEPPHPRTTNERGRQHPRPRAAPPT